MRLSFASSFAVVSAFALSCAAAPASAQTFGTHSPADFGQYPFGLDSQTPGTIGAFAQTFFTPTGSPVLQSFTFYLNEGYVGYDLHELQVEADVFAWSGDHVTGNALYSSTMTGSTRNDGTPDPLLFSGVGLLLAPNTSYALVLRAASTSSDGATNTFFTNNNASSSTACVLCQLFYSTTTTASTDDLKKSGAFTLSNSDSFGSQASLSVTFVPQTSTVPEPGSVALVAAGLAGVVVLARRRRTNA